MKSLFRCASWFPRLLAGEGVQGAALVLPRTPAAGLACLHIKIQISGGCLNGATQERSEFRRTSRLQGSPFLSPISFGDAKEMGSAVGPRPDPLPESKHTASTRSRLAPIPAFPQQGKETHAPSPPPSPASGRGSSRRSACATPHASRRTGVPPYKNSNFRRLFERSDAGATGVQPDKPPARLAFSFPHFFWRGKRNGVGCRAKTRLPPSAEANRSNKKQERPPSLPSPNGGRRKASSPSKKRTFQTAEQLTQN